MFVQGEPSHAGNTLNPFPGSVVTAVVHRNDLRLGQDATEFLEHGNHIVDLVEKRHYDREAFRTLAIPGRRFWRGLIPQGPRGRNPRGIHGGQGTGTSA